jgi:hypothetical protein
MSKPQLEKPKLLTSITTITETTLGTLCIQSGKRKKMTNDHSTGLLVGLKA